MNSETVTITKMAYGGSGIGHRQGKVCFVPYTAPGDVVKIRVVQEKRSHLFAEVTEIIEPSPKRSNPQCPVFGKCGGCHWQHISYDSQLCHKEEIFKETLWRFGRIPSEIVRPAIPSPLQYNYRSRVQFKLRFADGKVHAGFYRPGSHVVQDLPTGCAIAHPTVNNLFPLLKQMVSRFHDRDKVPQIDIAVGENGDATVIIHFIGTDQQKAVSFFEKETADMARASGFFLQTGKKSKIIKIRGSDSLSYSLPRSMDSSEGDVDLGFSRGGFSQVNLPQNKQMVNLLHSWCDNVKGRLLDLFCGNGNFSLPLSHKFDSILGIESYEPSIADARKNCELNGVDNAEYKAIDATEGISRLIEAADTFDTLILDPPRTGAADIVAFLPQLSPASIIYISCDPVTLARDLSYLQQEYQVESSVPFDMFPHTYHLESMTLLTRR